MRPKARRVLAYANGHVLIVNDGTRQCFDESDSSPVPVYVCRLVNDRDAIAKWRGWLRSKAVVA